MSAAGQTHYASVLCGIVNERRHSSWSLEYYNLICYGSTDDTIFRVDSGRSSFSRERLFEHTHSGVEATFENDLRTLTTLPTLIVAELRNRISTTPARLVQISDLTTDRWKVNFRYDRLPFHITSEEVFNSTLFETNDSEKGRTHWAVKQGNLVACIMEIVNRRSVDEKPRFFDVHWPLPDRDHIAVMMPFTSAFECVYESIKDACQGLSKTIRVDDIVGPQTIINDVFSTIAQARLVICDLTGKNPNVLYETGLAHARNRDVIILTQAPDDVPFNLSHIRYITYSNNDKGLKALRETLRNWIRDGMRL